MRQRFFACASACAVEGPVGGEVTGTPQRSVSTAGAILGSQETRLSSYRLAAEPMDKLSLYISLYAPDPVLGLLPCPPTSPHCCWFYPQQLGIAVHWQLQHAQDKQHLIESVLH